ncbi:MAG: RDD family protein [Acidimicrobiia bacterium]|nr:RDD family protein [Acidimicrobiia bacterium]MDH5520029.1 RDD family protein [Acidimicrobiia bacterium]
MDDHTTAGASAPNRPPLLGRRVAAGLVDLAVVLLAAAAAAVSTLTRVPAIRQPDGSITFTDVDRRLVNGMTGPLSGGRLLGDTLWAFSTLDVLAVAAVALVAGVTVGVLIPRLTGDRSPGKLLLRLRVTTVDGRSPGVVRHLARTLASPIDLMPLVVPGLTGFAFAASNPDQQRIGDRLAGTIVVDHRASDDMVRVSEALDTRTRPRKTTPARLVPTIRSATLVVHAPARVDASLNRRPLPPDLDGDKVATPDRASRRAGATPVGHDHCPPERQPNGDTVDMNDRDSASESTTPESGATPIPVEERSTNPYPKPVRRSRDVTEEPQLPDFDSLTLPESSLSDMPLTNNDLFAALGLIPPADALDDEPPIPAALSAKPTPSSGLDTPDEPAQATVPRTVAPAVAATAPAVAPTAAPTTTARQGSSPAPDNRAPIWSEDWDAWIYWDTTLRTWFRHDMQQGMWVPMDES